MAIQARYEEEKVRQEALRQQIIADPEIVFREKWYEGVSEKNDAYVQTLDDIALPYSEEHLHKLMELNPGSRPAILRRKNLSSEFLTFYFERFYRAEPNLRFIELNNIFWNPNTPVPLIQEVVDDEPGGPLSGSARRALINRKQQSR